MIKYRIAAVIAIVIIVALAIGLVGSTAGYSIAINQKDSKIENLTSAIDSRNSQISDLQKKISNDNITINSLNASKRPSNQAFKNDKVVQLKRNSAKPN
jgi:peptidoglycan hydrolase CwlO-like protein